ncbi:MAG TPA: hypothetical protein VJB34_03640 [Bdellovibrionota bacterium]|nr:hypothetical protein [Bdellovibrionota bacterium]
MKKGLIILFSSFIFFSNVSFGGITAQKSESVVQDLKKLGKDAPYFINDFKKRLYKNKSVVKNEEDLKALLDDQVKKDRKILEFLKQDLENAVITNDTASVERATEGVVEYLGDRLAWNLMPYNVQSKEDITHQFKDMIEQAKKFYVPDFVLLGAVNVLLDSQSPYSPLSFNGYVLIPKTPQDYIIMKKIVSMNDLLGVPVNGVIEFYYGIINNKVVQWLKVPGESF